jgi:hypothetical protein
MACDNVARTVASSRPSRLPLFHFVNDGWRPAAGGDLTGMIGYVKAVLVEGLDGGAA